MKYRGRPFRTTIIYGISSAAVFLALNFLGWFGFLWPVGKYIFAWLLLAGYGLLLARWSGRNRFRVLPHFLALLIVFALARSELIMVLAGLSVLGWVRSWFCFPADWARALGAEFVIGAGGGVLVAFLAPGSLVSQALGILLFFLVQAGYFVIFDRPQEVPAEKVMADPFERARKEAESILSPELL